MWVARAGSSRLREALPGLSKASGPATQSLSAANPGQVLSPDGDGSLRGADGGNNLIGGCADHGGTLGVGNPVRRAGNVAGQAAVVGALNSHDQPEILD